MQLDILQLYLETVFIQDPIKSSSSTPASAGENFLFFIIRSPVSCPLLVLNVWSKRDQIKATLK